MLRRHPTIDNKTGRVTVPPNGRRAALLQYLLDCARVYKAMAHFRDMKLISGQLVEDRPLHPRRTLDQPYYWTLNTTKTRDRDQVVYRGTTVKWKCHEKAHSINWRCAVQQAAKVQPAPASNGGPSKAAVSCPPSSNPSPQANGAAGSRPSPNPDTRVWVKSPPPLPEPSAAGSSAVGSSGTGSILASDPPVAGSPGPDPTVISGPVASGALPGAPPALESPVATGTSAAALSAAGSMRSNPTPPQNPSPPGEADPGCLPGIGSCQKPCKIKKDDIHNDLFFGHKSVKVR